MQNFRTIGGPGGVFHILVPGVFLFLNLVGCAYLFPLTPQETREDIERVLGNPAMGVVIIVGFGYLIGVILRIFRSEYPDQWSARFLRFYDKNARPPENDKNRYAYEDFPYTQWVGTSIRNLPNDVREFYSNIWMKSNSRHFFNFSKILVISEDERAANEIHAAESLCRYISGMFYALVTSALLSIAVIISQVLALQVPNIVLLVLSAGYSIALLGILVNYRFMRIKEVHTVFYSAYKNSDLFQRSTVNVKNN